MCETTLHSRESSDAEPVVQGRRRKPLQIGLQTLALLVAAAAVWTSYFVNRRQNAYLEARIASSRPLARELVIEDSNQIAVVKLQELWYDENRWDFYLPAGEYRVCLATHAIDDEGIPPAVAKSGVIRAGRHHLALEQEPLPSGWRVSAKWDDRGELTVDEPKAWYPGVGSSGESEHSSSTQIAADQAVVLFRRRFAKRQASRVNRIDPMGPTEGLMLWIERVPGIKGEARPAP